MILECSHSRVLTILECCYLIDIFLFRLWGCF
jgi:hypothetical protein